ncbi:MAG TPA: tetratricopeptide repeat protein [Candidatus Limnocylindrales bacterium]|jgi:tetratricopeptide (TPR) repeat protein|nr:tetratricopeptide repeat protein [Candidatus Limnocylindrales bacterium]
MEPGPAASPGLPAPTRVDSTTQARIEFLVRRVKDDPNDGDAHLELGLALLQRIRETADPSLYAPAEEAFVAARRLLPYDPGPLVGLGGLQLGRHEFTAALATARSALTFDPGSVSASSIEVDALIELGRYDEAFEAIDDLAASSPNLITLSRLSYSRELRGDLQGALAAMRKAAESPSLAAENTAFVLSIVGHLERLDGDPQAARSAFETALDLVPNHAPSLAGLGRLAVGDGALHEAATYFERASAVVPLAEYVIALGETHQAAGDLEAARRQYDLARAEITLFKANGVAVDLDLALFEADHGNTEEALRLAESAYDAAPTVRAADALAWCLLHNGRTAEALVRSQEALRLGSRDPLLLYHAGMIEADHGDFAIAREHLAAALAADPGFSAIGARDARTLLEGLSGAS